jgi:tripartite-type tricarboxylate transporter receptor subunit TctC
MKMRGVGEILTGIQSQLSLLFLLTLDIHRNTNMKHRRMILGLMGLCFAALAPYCWGQSNYPDRPVRLVIPFPPGGPSDVLGRSLAQKLSTSLGKPVIIENKPGAGTNLAADLVAKSPPDGHTLLLMMVGTQAINETMYPKLSYDTVKDFAPITLVAASSLALAAHPSVPAKTLPELIKLAKANPGKYNYASSGSGTPLHLGGELLSKAAGIQLVHVPYKGAAPAVQDLLGGQVQLGIVGTPGVLNHLKTGRLNVLAVTSAQRSSLAPEIPTVAETLPGYEVELVYAVLATAGTPSAVVERLNNDIHQALKDPEIRERLVGQGFEIRTSSPEQLGQYIRSEIRKWSGVVKESGVKPE